MTTQVALPLRPSGHSTRRVGAGGGAGAGTSSALQVHVVGTTRDRRRGAYHNLYGYHVLGRGSCVRIINGCDHERVVVGPGIELSHAIRGGNGPQIIALTGRR